MLKKYDPAIKAPEDTPAWSRNFRDISQLALFLRKLFPDPEDQERLMDRAGEYVVRYAAWETIRQGRASLVVGNPQCPAIQEGPLPYTGFEGYLAGSDISLWERVNFIARTGSHFRHLGYLVFSDAIVNSIQDFLNGNLEIVSKYSVETLRSMVLTADTLFNWVRQHFKEHIDRNADEFEDFKSATYAALKSMPEAYYTIDPITHHACLSIPLPQEQLRRHGPPYKVVLNPTETQGYLFLLALSKASLPPFCAASQEILNPLEHNIDGYL